MIFLILSSLWFIVSISQAQPITDKETIKRTLQFPNQSADHQLLLKNIMGNIRIVGYEGKEVKFTVEKTIEARNQNDLQKGMDEIILVTEIKGSTMLAYMDAPFVNLKWKNGQPHFHVNREDDDYTYRLDFTLQVPHHLNLDVSTVNGGIVEIENVHPQYVITHNVNGGIHCRNISGQTTAITVNGDVDIQFEQAPKADSRFKTVNGDINLLIPKDISADISFKSMNGDFYTNFEELDYLPAEVKTDGSSSGKRTTYKINQTTKFRIGKGGPLLQMETLNGEMFLKHN